MKKPSEHKNDQKCQIDYQENVKQMNKFQSMETDDLLKLYMGCKKCNQMKFILDKFKKFIKIHGDQVVIESIPEGKTRSLQQVRKEFSYFVKGKPLNQSLLVSLIKSKRFSAFLQYFLEYYVDEWILKSELKKREFHMICISFIKRCFQDPTLIDNIIKYKKKN